MCQDYLMKEHDMSALNAGLWASVLGGVLGAVLSHPFDCVKTCMQGDLEQKSYGNNFTEASHRVWLEGGMKRMFDGCFWRTVNITLTVWIANECRQHLPPLMFPRKFEDDGE